MLSLGGKCVNTLAHPGSLWSTGRAIYGWKVFADVWLVLESRRLKFDLCHGWWRRGRTIRGVVWWTQEQQDMPSVD